MPKSYADATIPTLEPTTAWVNNQLNAAIATNNLVTQSYVDNTNAGLAQQAAVTSADNTYAAASSLNAASGVAGLDGAGNLLTTQLPASVPTEFTAKSYDLATYGIVLMSGTGTVSTSNLRELQIAKISVPDPGYPWRPFPIAWVAGGNPNQQTAPTNRTKGTNNYGLLSVIPPVGISDQVYGAGVCTDSYYLNYYPVRPYAGAGQTPITVPAVQGPLDLLLCGCCWTGSGYEFSSQGLQYWILTLPAM
jgi:hypothetical protein